MPRRKTKPAGTHEEAERVLEASSQPVSTESREVAPGSDRQMHAVDPRDPEDSDLEQTMRDYYDRSDVEGQGGVPTDPPDHDPMPLQHLDHRSKQPPKHNM